MGPDLMCLCDVNVDYAVKLTTESVEIECETSKNPETSSSESTSAAAISHISQNYIVLNLSRNAIKMGLMFQKLIKSIFSSLLSDSNTTHNNPFHFRNSLSSSFHSSRAAHHVIVCTGARNVPSF